MTAATEKLPIDQVVEPESIDELVDAVRAASSEGLAIYPIGGGTALDFGLPATEPGIGVSLRRLNSVIDYPARDMTITVEAGITIDELAETLRSERQQLAIDVPSSDQATLGGVMASDASGARRYGYGTMRDYVIGVEAVDCDGRRFKAGGRVVKNVAGYDFCKLLTGSLGTLGIITQITLKLKPIAPSNQLVVTPVVVPDQAERLLASIVDSRTNPVAVELLAGPNWNADEALGETFDDQGTDAGRLAVGLEGTDIEVAWMADQLQAEWRTQAAHQVTFLPNEEAAPLWRRLADFPADSTAALVLKATMLPAAVASFVHAVRALDKSCSVQAHAGDGVVIVRFPDFPEGGLSQTLIRDLVPMATAAGGNIVVLSNPSRAEMTHQSVWGGIDAPFHVMTKIKKQFDPDDRLNPGRFVYGVVKE